MRVLIWILVTITSAASSVLVQNTTTSGNVTLVVSRPTDELRRSGRFQCQEQVEDLERIQRQGRIRCRCPEIFAPVCGSDGETYHNRCFLTCTATLKYQGFSAAPLTLRSWGPCPVDESS